MALCLGILDAAISICFCMSVGLTFEVRLHFLRARKCLISNQYIRIYVINLCSLLRLFLIFYICMSSIVDFECSGWIKVCCSICFLVASDVSRAGSQRARGLNRGMNISTYNKDPGIVKFTIEEIFRATRNFSPSFKIGQGGFGAVYKAKLLDGTVVAVKRAKKVVLIVFLAYSSA